MFQGINGAALPKRIKCLYKMNIRTFHVLIYKASTLPFPYAAYINKLGKKEHDYSSVKQKWYNQKRQCFRKKQEDGVVGYVNMELKFKTFKAAWSKVLVKKGCALKAIHVTDSYLARFHIEVYYLLSLSETKSSNFAKIAHLPVFHQELCCSFNECKRQINEKRFSYKSFAHQPIWNNKLFEYVNETIRFTDNQQNEILYVNDFLRATHNF